MDVSGTTRGITLTLNAGGADTLTGTNGVNQFVLTGSNTGSLNPFWPSPTAFNSFENLLGYIGNDTFVFANAQAAVSGWIDGGTDTDTLDYSALGTDVVVNMVAYTATGVGWYIYQVENAVGGAGNDVLVGDQWSNALTGGPGRDVLIGGGIDWNTFTYSLLPDVLNGGGGEDILIAGYTYYDFDPTWIRDVWALQATYAERISWLEPWLNAGTVFYNYATAGNTLTGGADLDWFFGQPALDLGDWDSLTEGFVQIY